MEKREIIERTKKAYQFYKENKIYQALKEIYPVAVKVKTEKVQKLYKVLILKATKLLEDLYKAKEYNKLEEIEYMFFEGINLPQIKSIFEKVKEERKKLLEELEEQQTEVENFNLEDELIADNFEDENFTTLNPENEMSATESESFEFDAENFKLSSFSEDEMGEQDVNALIQKGVSLYEVGDIENALVVWEQALNLQPDNTFLQEYIDNAKKELGINEQEAKNEQLQTPEPEFAMQEEKIEEKEEESVEIVFDENELSGELKRAIAVARSGDIDRAKNIIRKLFETGEIDETNYVNSLKFVSKLENEVGLSIVKNRIKNLIEDKEFEEALNYLEKNADKLSFDEKNRIERHILQKKQEVELSKSFELELDEEEEPVKQTQTVIQPPQRKPRAQAKKRKTNIKRKKKSNLGQFFKTTFFFLLLIIILATVVFYGISIIKKNVQGNENNFDFQTFQVKEKQQEKKKLFEKFTKEARQYFDMGEYLFAYYTYLHAERYGTLSDMQISFLTKARRLMKREMLNKKRELAKAERYFKRGEYEKAIPAYKNLLAENPENLQLKEKLFTCYKNTAIKYALQNNVLKAKTYFKYALVLNRNDEEIPKHIKVLNRYLKGRINHKLLTQWFYFFIK